MSEKELSEGISFNNMRINSMVSSSGVFAGRNLQYLWHSESRTQSGFGTIAGEGNSLKNPSSIVTDPESSSEVLEYFQKLIKARIGE